MSCCIRPWSTSSALKVPSPPGSRSCAGSKSIDKVIVIDQSPIGARPLQSATYTGAFRSDRQCLPPPWRPKARGYQVGQIQFNVKGGRCEPASGQGGET